MQKAQTTIELMTILAVALVILAVLISFTAEQVVNVQKQRAIKTAEQAVLELVNTANELYTQGPGAARYLQFTWPEGVSSTGTYLQDSSIVVSVYGTNVTGTATPPLSGVLPTNSGLQYILIRSYDGYVVIGEPYITMSPTYVLSSLSRDTNAGTRITLTNLLQDDVSANVADVNLVASWSHTDVNLVITPSTFQLGAAASTTFDVNFRANSSAVGTYTGKVTVIATFPSRVETLVLPVQANVNVATASNIVTFPTTISLSTFGADTNSMILQVCNVGDTDLKTVSLASSGSTSTWFDGYSDINTLAAQSCTSVDVNVTVPEYPIGAYTGSLSISDYTGANHINVPVTVTIRGMNSVFSWDWSTAFHSVQSIHDFTVSNSGRKPIQLSSAALRKWWACDSDHSLWNTFVINNTTRYSGAIADGNAIDFADFNIPVLTSYTDNELTFSSVINDENEQFAVDVNFSDGTQYTSSVFGNGCSADTTAPGIISDLNAIPGPEPQSIMLRFTAPGDDNMSGSATGFIFKYASTAISNDTDFNNARLIYPTPASYTPPHAGTTASYVFEDINIGAEFYFAAKAYDENGNVGPLSTYSNRSVASAWNRFSFSGNDFNFVNFSPANTIVMPPNFVPQNADVNQFDLNIFSFTPGVSNDQIQIRIASDTNSSLVWATILDFNDFVLKRARIWYPSFMGFQQSAQFDQNFNYSFTGDINLLDTSLFGTVYVYGGSVVDMPRPNHLYVDVLTGISDFNIVVQNSTGAESAFTPL